MSIWSPIIGRVEAIFKALSDQHRRMLLDRLFKRDGQTLSELQTELPSMTRFGVMKHVRVLEAAGLVTTRRSGRKKLHYLNPVPIRLVLDRWISKYAEPWVEAVTGLKNALEADMEGPKHVYEVYIRTTPEKLWESITSADFTSRYFLGGRVESDWKRGSTIAYAAPDGTHMIDGKILEVDKPQKLVHTFALSSTPEAKGDRASRVTWEIAPGGDGVCKLTLTHDDFDGETATFQGVGPGWNPILSGLKTLLETGEPLLVGAM